MIMFSNTWVLFLQPCGSDSSRDWCQSRDVTTILCYMCIRSHHCFHRQLAPNCLHTSIVFSVFSGSTSSGQGTYHGLLLGYDKADHSPNLPFYNLQTYLNANINKFKNTVLQRIFELQRRI